MKPYTGKNIWIIGASSGIGRALAHELAHQGARLVLTARRESELEALKAELDGDGHTVESLDVTDRAALGEAVGRLKNLDSVIFLAALYRPHSKTGYDLDFMHKMLEVNIGGAFNIVDAVKKFFKKQGHGQIVICASVAGYRGLPSGQPYCATKAALINYAESLKIDLEPDNIDVKVINPGFVRTPLTDKNNFKMPMIIEPEDAAKAIAKGLQSQVFEIHFPKKFTFIMKLLRFLPAPLYFMLARKMRP